MYSNYNRNRLSNEKFNQEYSPPRGYNSTPPLPPPPMPPISQTSQSQAFHDPLHGGVSSSSQSSSWEYKDQRSNHGQQYSQEQGQVYRDERNSENSQRQNYSSDRNFTSERSYLERNQISRQSYLERNQSHGQNFSDRHQHGTMERNQPLIPGLPERDQPQGQNYMERNQPQGNYLERDYSPREEYATSDTAHGHDYSDRVYSQGPVSSERFYSQEQNYSNREYAQGQSYSEIDHTHTPVYSEKNPYQEEAYATSTNNIQQNYQEQSYQDYNYNQDALHAQNSQDYDTSGYANEQYPSTTAYDPYDPVQESAYSQTISTAYPEGGEGIESNGGENGANIAYESPLKALENKRTISEDSYLPKNHFAKKVVNIFDRKTEIPDHRRPPPVKVDPNVPADIAALFKTNDCQLCEVKLNSRVQAKTHYEGKPHARKLKLTLDKRYGRTSDDESSVSDNAKVSKKSKLDATTTTTTTSEPPKKKKPITDGTQLYCKCCELSFTSIDHATQHYLGRNHHRVLHGLKPLKPGYYNEDTGKWQRSPTDPITPTERLPVTKDADGNSESEGGEKGSFFCNLCGVAATSSEQLEGHMQGVRHKRIQQIKQKKKKPGSDSILASVIKEKTNRKSKTFNNKPKDFSIYRTPSGKFYCSPCDLTLNSEVQFAQHVESKKHKIKKK